MAEVAKKTRGAWLREMKSELKKVTWPGKKTVLKNTGTVLLCSLLIGACFLQKRQYLFSSSLSGVFFLFFIVL